MKVILPILFSLLLFGCGGRTERMRTLLLQQDSLNRAYVTFTTDSTVRLLADYFDHHGTNLDRVLAHYLLGSALRDIREAPAALDEFQKAAELADTTQGGDSIFALLAKIHGQMGILFIRQYLPTQAKESFQIASENAIKSQDTLLALDYRRFIVSSYYQQREYDSVDYFTERIFQTLQHYGDTVNAARSLGVAIAANIERDSLEKARRYMVVYERDGDIFDEKGHVRASMNIYNYYRGLYYMKMGRLHEAEQLFRDVASQSTNMEQVKGGYDGLRRIFTLSKQRDSTLKYTSLYTDANDTFYAQQVREEAIRMQSLYKYDRIHKIAIRKTLQLEKAKILFIVSSAVILLIIFTAFYLYRKRKIREFLQTHVKYVVAQEEISRLETELEQEKKYSYQSVSEKKKQEQKIMDLSDEIAELRHNLYELRPEADILDTLRNMIRAGISLSSKDWKDIMKFLTDNDPSFMYKLERLCPSLTTIETRVCVLTRMGHSVGNIAILMDKSVASISKNRKHLMKKIFNDPSGAKRFDNKIANI